MNFSDDKVVGQSEELGRFSNKQQDVLIIAGNTSKTNKIYVKAASQLRQVISNKLKMNLDIENEDIAFIKDYIRLEVNKTSKDTDNFLQNYIEGIKNKASRTTIEGESPGADTLGRWGGEIELQLASAVFSFRYYLIQPDNTEIEFRADIFRQNFLKDHHLILKQKRYI